MSSKDSENLPPNNQNVKYDIKSILKCPEVPVKKTNSRRKKTRVSTIITSEIFEKNEKEKLEMKEKQRLDIEKRKKERAEVKAKKEVAEIERKKLMAERKRLSEEIKALSARSSTRKVKTEKSEVEKTEAEKP
ncbi:hypothetical protein TKK_0012958 [Trichogramma kaykai]